MRRATIVVCLYMLVGCDLGEEGDIDEMSECADGVCPMDFDEGVDAGASSGLWMGPPRIRSSHELRARTYEPYMPGAVERDQAPDLGTETSPDELPVFDWQAPVAQTCQVGGVCGTGHPDCCPVKSCVKSGPNAQVPACYECFMVYPSGWWGGTTGNACKPEYGGPGSGNFSQCNGIAGAGPYCEFCSDVPTTDPKYHKDGHGAGTNTVCGDGDDDLIN